jgi:hypothetical protein
LHPLYRAGADRLTRVGSALDRTFRLKEMEITWRV